VGDLPLSLQAKLLSAVEEKSITPLGAEEPVSVNIKILSATNHDLLQMIGQATFREDLYYRLNTVHIDMPLLRDRTEDIDQLITFFLKKFSHSHRLSIPTITQDTVKILHAWPWPGNVRELANIMERLVLNCGEGSIRPECLPKTMWRPKESGNSAAAENMNLNSREKELIISALQKNGWNQTRAAQQLGITRNTLRYRIKKFRIDKI
jgi:transcriptional regulator with PAS, ATPase and Fis domain